MLLHIRNRGVDIDALRVVERAGAIADPDDLATLGHHQLGRRRPDVAEALHRDRCALHGQPEVIECLAGHQHAPTARGFTTPLRTTHLDRLARHHGVLGATDVHRVGVHHPRHDALVRIHIGRGDVGVGAQQRDDALGVAARDALQFPHAHRERITNHTTLRTAERQIDDRAFPSHPRGEGFHFLERDLHVEADPTLGRSTRRVVQHAVTGEHLHVPVVELNGHRHDELFFWIA